jgi:hypothetical protein
MPAEDLAVQASVNPIGTEEFTMKVVMTSRDMVYALLKACFDSINSRPCVAEIGVLNGKNADNL